MADAKNTNKIYADVAKQWGHVNKELQRLSKLADKAQASLAQATAQAAKLAEQVTTAVTTIDADKVDREVKAFLKKATTEASKAGAQVTKATEALGKVDLAVLHGLFEKKPQAPAPAKEKAAVAPEGPAKKTVTTKAAKPAKKAVAKPAKKTATKKASPAAKKAPAKKAAKKNAS